MAGRATGELIGTKKRAQIVNAAANGHSINKISKTVNVARSTATVVVNQEKQTILQRKERLTDVYAEIAQRGAERLLDGIDNAPYGSLTVITGMSTDKLIALTTDPQSQLNNHIHVHLEKVDLIGQFNQAMRQLSNGATVSEKISTAVASTQEKQISAKEIENKPVQSNT